MRQQSRAAAVTAMENMLAAGTALVLAEPTRQRQRTLLEQMRGLGDDLARAHIALGDPAAAVVALGQGRGIVLNLTAAIAGERNHPELGVARSEWRTAQVLADKAEERERSIEAVAADGHADTADLAAAGEAAAAARHGAY